MKNLYLTFCSLFILSNAFAQLNMQLLDKLDYTQNINDVWGWAHPTDGTEYALVGTQTGLSIVDITIPTAINEVQFINGPNSTWRDIKSWGDFVYVTNENTGGLLVVDMSGAPNAITWERWEPNISDFNTTLGSCHNIYIDEFGYAYLSGCNMNSGGVLIVDVFSTPGDPSYVTAAPNIYAHDAFAQNNVLYTSDIYAGEMGIYDVTDKSDISFLASQGTPRSFTHNVWVNEENTVAFTTDEKGNAPVAAYDITDFDDIVELDQFKPLFTINQNVIPHNVHVWDNWLIISYYTDGGIIADASRPENIIEVGNWDTFLGGNGGFSGVWGAYPFLPSGLVLLTDRQGGLHVCGADYVRACWLEGKITDANTGAAIFGADVEIQSTQASLTSSDLIGEYKTGQAIPGTFDVEVSATGYLTKVVPATLENGVLTILDVELFPIVPVSSYSGQVVSAIDGSPIAAAQVILHSQSNEFKTLTDQNGEFTFNNIFRDEYTLASARWGFKHGKISNLLIESSTAPATLEMHLGYQDDYFSSQGWTNETTASEGWWERDIPAGELYLGEPASPYKDLLSDIGDHCYVTSGARDVDDGYVQLISPAMDLTLYYEPIISYYTWFFNEGNAPNDTFQVRINNGTEEVVLETITTSNSAWNDRSEIKVSDYISITDNMKVIFEVEDVGTDHLVEGAVDGFLVYDSAFPPFEGSDNSCPDIVNSFEDASDYAYEWAWSFENGMPDTSNAANPTTVFEISGTHDIALTVTTKTGETFNLSDQIDIGVLPTSNFSMGNLDTLAVTFDNTSSAGIDYTWNFGDGSQSNDPNPTHNFPAPGTYTVELTVVNDCGTDVITEEITVLPYQPTASFSENVTEGCAPLSVQFTDNSFGFPDTYNWSFPGGTPATSNDPNPLVVYNDLGVYEVTLEISNVAGTSTSVKTGLVNVDDVPDVNFDFTIDGALVEFINNSTNANTYNWIIDDSTIMNIDPLHHFFEFGAVGTYDVILEATNDCGTNSITNSVFVEAVLPTADFSASQSIGCEPFTVEFSDQSLDVPTSWQWSFPGGTPATSTEQNPIVTYQNSGTYSVVLSIANSAGTSESVQTDIIVVNAAPTSDFDFSVNGPEVVFTNNSSDADSYEWQFNDGSATTSTDKNPTFTFPDLGDYEVILNATNDCGTVTNTAIVTITAIQPSADFTASESNGCAPFAVTFNDQSYGGEINNWEWSFPGGTPATSTEQNPTVTYSQAGTYSATLKVVNPIGDSEISINDVIIVSDVPATSFDFDVNGATATFTNNSSNADSYAWDFGDGNSSIEENPVYQFNSLGDFDVVLNSTNECGTTTQTVTLTITAIQPTADFTANESNGCAPFVVTFNDQSIGGEIDNWEWSFPGGMPTTSSEQNPTIVYNQMGVYSASLKVTNPVGESDVEMTDLIIVNDVPTSDFNFSSNGVEVVFTNNSINANNYQWDFGDGNSSTDSDPSFVYADTGTYQVILTAFNDCGETTFTQTVEISTLTSTNDLSDQLIEFKASPNPFSDNLKIEYQLKSLGNNAQLVATNLLGKIIYTEKLNNPYGQVLLNKELNGNGIYFLQIIIDHQSIETIKVLKF